MKTAAVFSLAIISLCAAATYEDFRVVPFNQGKYLLSSFNSTWVEASKFCKSIGFALLDVESAEQNAEILKVFGAAIPDRVWIGGTDLGKEGSFYWGQSLSPFNVTFWHVNEPSGTNNNTGIKEDCVLYWNRNGTILWNDAPCENSYQFICEGTDAVEPCASR